MSATASTFILGGGVAVAVAGAALQPKKECQCGGAECSGHGGTEADDDDRA